MAKDVMETNTRSASKQVDYHRTQIAESPLAKSSDPFALLARDVAVRTQKVVRRGSGSYGRGMGTGRQIAMDADTSVVLRYLDLDTPVEHAVTYLGQALAMKQKNRSALGFWVGLRSYLGSMPSGARVADCNLVLLSRSLQALEANCV